MDRLKDFLRGWLLSALAPSGCTLTITRDDAPAPSGAVVPPRAGRGVPVADLLGRPAVNLDTPELQRFLAGKRVLVTGAGGSIGSEICRQMMRFCPSRVILVERAENNLFEIDRELRERWVGADIKPCIADVCDARRIGQVFRSERPQVVFHCAAHKHVPMMEHNPCEAIKNNIFGTKTVADAALATGVTAFVLISSDKAVNPSSVMGATKRVGELYIQSLNGSALANPNSEIRIPESNPNDEIRNPKLGMGHDFGIRHSDFGNDSGIRGFGDSEFRASGRTRFVAVRFGNVLGSSGSVVPIFQKQIEAGGPVTVTHPDMRRYFMTIPEASQLVMQAGAIGKGGEIFVLDMGQPVRIVDLARELIRRNGLVPDADILVQFTGVRPGEKLYEELACDDEQTRPTSHEKIRVWELPPADAAQVARGLDLLSAAAESGPREAVAALKRCVPEYRPNGSGAPAKPEVPPLRLVPTEAEAA